ncbi:BON domain-containing protein [Candidatus Nitrospira allomarina]|jgi:osmotically-inducible protein OsmY|uniref:Osmotically-inducible protein Y n=1 Tax=Candidatus Nitrospira allomarina TaxID=3020900 RepID=A0AA96GCC8_9BACT|nr:BON domain-containing protein [Candidatus Nitrospira allomarina]WNM59168.1 BON domain-containing protein [Candidatus Nitrospira allomarina]
MTTTFTNQLRVKAMLMVASVVCALAFSACASDPHGRSVGTTVDDAVITSSVKSSLIADDLVDAFEVEVDTHRSTVMLSGFVETQNQIDRAVEIAKKTDGVQKVVNKLAIKPKAMSKNN